MRPFVLYSLRHTFLTRLGESGCDVWTLARIAGHSSDQNFVPLRSSVRRRSFGRDFAAGWAQNWAHAKNEAPQLPDAKEAANAVQ